MEELQQRCRQVLSQEAPGAAALQELLDVSFAFDVDLPQLAAVRVRLEQARWLEEVQQACLEPGALTLDDMRRLIDLGVGLAPDAAVEKAMARLQELLTVSEHWDDKARGLLRARWAVRRGGRGALQRRLAGRWDRDASLSFLMVKGAIPADTPFPAFPARSRL